MNLLNDKKFHEKIDDEFFQKYCSISILFNRTAKIIRDNHEIAGYRSQSFKLYYFSHILSHQ